MSVKAANSELKNLKKIAEPDTMSENTEEVEEEKSAEENAEEDAVPMKTILYCKVRDSLTAEDLRTIKDALEEDGYFLKPSEDGSKLMIQREKLQGTIDFNSVLQDE